MKVLAGVLSIAAGVAQADIVVRFDEGAPKDSFTIENLNTCATAPMDVTIDLEPANVGLIFDTTAQGDGVEVFQPFEITMGSRLVTGASAVTDGDKALTLSLIEMQPLAKVRFTIDLDDTGGAREITVSGAEIEGAMIRIVSDAGMIEGTFDDTAQAIIPLDTCMS